MELHIVTSNKGGQGKTSLCLTLGAILRHSKKTLLYIDLNYSNNDLFSLFRRFARNEDDDSKILTFGEQDQFEYFRLPRYSIFIVQPKERNETYANPEILLNAIDQILGYFVNDIIINDWPKLNSPQVCIVDTNASIANFTAPRSIITYPDKLKKLEVKLWALMNFEEFNEMEALQIFRAIDNLESELPFFFTENDFYIVLQPDMNKLELAEFYPYKDQIGSYGISKSDIKESLINMKQYFDEKLNGDFIISDKFNGYRPKNVIPLSMLNKYNLHSTIENILRDNYTLALWEPELKKAVNELNRNV